MLFLKKLHIRYFLLVLLFCSFSNLLLGQKIHVEAGNWEFIENKNQWHENVLYKADMNYGALFLEKNCFTYNFFNPKERFRSFAHHDYKGEPTDGIVHYHAFKIHFLNGNKDVKINALNRTSDYCNYFIGNDHSKWASRVRKYKGIKYSGIYKNIDMMVYSHGNALKYDFVINPGGNVRDIALSYEGVDNLKVVKGNLIINTSVNKIIEVKPYAYQEYDGGKEEISCKYKINGNIVTFSLSNYDETKPLIIDPILIFSTYTGSTVDNWGFTATFEGNGGAVYAGGVAFGTGYPVSVGAYQQTYGGVPCDVSIIKYDSLGTNRLYATYLGGTGSEMPHSLIVNDYDELVIFGTTGSANFPVTTGAYDTTFNGGTNVSYDNVITFPNGVDIFVAKLDSAGNSLLASTYVGGTANDGLNYRNNITTQSKVMSGNDSLYFNYADGARGEVIIDNHNDVYIGSNTFSSDFPVTATAFQPVYAGKEEGVAFKLDYTLSTLVWSSFIGGGADDAVYSIDVDDKNYDVYVAGGTNSSNFPTTMGAYQTTYLGGSADGFVAHISNNGNTLIGSTYYGSNEYDQAFFVRTDKDNDVYIVGQTKAKDSTLVYNAQYKKPNSGQFVAKFYNPLNALEWSTVFGTGNGKPNITLTAFAVDICNRIYLAGSGREWAGLVPGLTWTNIQGTNGMDITPSAFQNTTDGQDFYIMVMTDDASLLEFATFFGEKNKTGTGYLGQDHVDGGTARFDKKGTIYQSACASCGGSDSFPTFPKPGAWSNSNNAANCNNAVIKYNIHNDYLLANFILPIGGCVPDTVLFVNTSYSTSPLPPQYKWFFGDGDSSIQAQPTHIYMQAGTYKITLVASDTGSCNLTDTIEKFITVIDDTTYSLPDTIVCLGDPAVQIGEPSSPGLTYRWVPSTGLNIDTIANPYANPTSTTSYVLLRSNGICTDTIYQDVIVFDLDVDAGIDDTICEGIQVILQANAIGDSTITYIWSTSPNFTDTLNNPISNNTAVVNNITTSTFFYVKAQNIVCDAIDTIYIYVSHINLRVDSAVNPLCNGDCNGRIVVSVLPPGGTLPYQYIWNTTPPQTTNTATNLCAGTYTVTVTDADSCVADTTIILTEPTPLVLDVDSCLQICKDSCTGHLYADISGGTPLYSYAWSTSPPQTNQTANNLCEGTYVVTITDDHGCIITDSATVKDSVIDYVQLITTVDDDTIYKGQTTFIRTTLTPSNMQGTYSWQPAEGLSSTTILNPEASPTITTTYNIVVNIMGCLFYDTVTIYVVEVRCDEPYIYVPNAFTPNEDGNNDVLFVRGDAIDELYFVIYDRWGEKIFETRDIHKGWDGTYGGKKCNPGVFDYYLEVNCFGDEQYFSKGNITLIR